MELLHPQNTAKPIAYMTKAKYRSLCDEMRSKYGGIIGENMVDSVLETICNVLMFDPNACSYNKEKLIKLMKQRGLTSSYQVYGKKFYENNRETLSKNNAEKQRSKRAEHMLCVG